jgi:hypothetical protein
VLGVSNGIANDILEEDLEDAASLLVDEARDTLDAATTGETSLKREEMYELLATAAAMTKQVQTTYEWQAW